MNAAGQDRQRGMRDQPASTESSPNQFDTALERLADLLPCALQHIVESSKPATLNQMCEMSIRLQFVWFCFLQAAAEVYGANSTRLFQSSRM